MKRWIWVPGILSAALICAVLWICFSFRVYENYEDSSVKLYISDKFYCFTGPAGEGSLLWEYYGDPNIGRFGRVVLERNAGEDLISKDPMAGWYMLFPRLVSKRAKTADQSLLYTRIAIQKEGEEAVIGLNFGDRRHCFYRKGNAYVFPDPEADPTDLREPHIRIDFGYYLLDGTKKNGTVAESDLGELLGKVEYVEKTGADSDSKKEAAYRFRAYGCPLDSEIYSVVDSENIAVKVDGQYWLCRKR